MLAADQQENNTAGDEHIEEDFDSHGSDGLSGLAVGIICLMNAKSVRPLFACACQSLRHFNLKSRQSVFSQYAVGAGFFRAKNNRSLAESDSR